MGERRFEDQVAKRERVPLLIGLAGPSGSGKTFSALRLATGMQRVTGGEIFVVDTEARRALHYADQFGFRHLEFRAPFGPLDYLAAIEHCVKKQAGVVVVDSMSHEHEGPGGVLDLHDQALDRMAGQDYGKRNRMTFSAWAEPKSQRRRLINSILQLGVNAIFCFRAKEKIKIQKGKDPIELGWMPIAGEEFVYEMTLQCLLYPGSGGVPTWKTEQPGEKAMTKLPLQFQDLFEQRAPLSEDLGETMARWAEGDAKQPTDEELAAVIAKVGSAESVEDLQAISTAHRREAWSPKQRADLNTARQARKAALGKTEGDEPKGDDPCPHPDGFGTSESNPTPHCVHCGASQAHESAKAQGRML